MPKDVAVKDTDRVNYYRGVTASLQAAINDDGVDVRGYLAWSKFDQRTLEPRLIVVPLGLLDNFEWSGCCGFEK